MDFVEQIMNANVFENSYGVGSIVEAANTEEREADSKRGRTMNQTSRCGREMAAKFKL